MPTTEPALASTDLPRSQHSWSGFAVPQLVGGTLLWWSILGVMAIGFLFVGVNSLDLSPTEARLGLAVGSGMGPFGKVYGGWATDVWPLPLALGRIWAMFEGTWASAGVVRWPGAFAALLLVAILARRSAEVLGGRAGLLTGLTTLGSLALIDRSSLLGLDVLAALGVVAALDRIIAKGPDTRAGLWLSLAFLSAGWPPVALVGLTLLILQRKDAGVPFRFVIPVVLTVASWSIWACVTVSPEAWLTALGMPLTQKSAWGLVPNVITLGLPWAPIALLLAWPSVRAQFGSTTGTPWVMAWIQALVVCLVVGTVIPGLAMAARLPAVLALCVLSAACLDCAWVDLAAWPASARRVFAGLLLLVVALWAAIVVGYFGYLSLAVTYYRPLAIVLFALVGPTLFVAILAASSGQGRRAVIALGLVACGLKIAYVGFFAPEWNYKTGQGPWGRAIGQWVPARRLIYTSHVWQPDLAFATERQFHQLVNPRVLEYQRDPLPRFVLLHDQEFAHWPEDAMPLVKMAEFEDAYGSKRVLARTAGPFSWRQASIDARAYKE